MELLPDGGFVRLQSLANGKYIHADGNWKKVSLRSLSRVPSLEAVWRVQRWVSDQDDRVFVLFQSAAYGRYLSYWGRPWRHGPFGRHVLGHGVVQRDYNEPNLLDAMFCRWTPERVRPDQDHVRLRLFGSHLRNNGRYLMWDNRRVTADDTDWFAVQLFTMMQWTVHTVASTPLPLLPPAAPAFPPPEIFPLQEYRGSRLLWAFWWFFGYGPGVYEDVPREIRYVRADDQGNIDPDHWLSFIEHDLPVAELWRYLANLQGGPMFDFTLCIRPGSHGRLMPLVTHLPRSRDTLNIVILRTGSPAALELRYPELYAPAQ